MNILNVEQVTKSYTEKKLLEKVTCGIEDTDKIGIIGINGTGKSTLLKIVAGVEEPDVGKVIKGNNIKIEYLPQNPELKKEYNILENVLYSQIEDRIKWEMEGRAKSILNKLNIYDYEGKVEYLSGGEKKRVALARTVLTPAEILVLDEPTNHLDSSMAEWLENYLNNFKGAIVMVTHDRYFLDKVTNKIFEIDKGSLYSYEANYSKFLELKALREEMQVATERKNKSLYRVELEWMMRGPRARSTKQKAHIQRFEKLRDREKIEEEQKMKLSSIYSRMGKKTIELNNISKSFEDKHLIKDFSYIFLKHDRVGIVGHNGCGKSTLMKIIMGIEKADSGNIEIGQTIKIGYFSQENEYLDENQRVIDYIKDIAEYLDTVDGKVSASTMLERFLFTSDMQYSYIGKLSGGEKRRLYLLKVLMEAPNVLILDEPTNDLDIKTMTILEDYLDTFDGIVITVSHDRYFLDRVVRRIFAFENGNIVQYEGGFTEYQKKSGGIKEISVENKKDKEHLVLQKQNSKATWKQKDNRIKFTYKEQKEYETIDEVIENLESKIVELDEKIIRNSTDFVKLNELTKEKENTEKELEEKMQRWEYLNELAEKIENQNKKS